MMKNLFDGCSNSQDIIDQMLNPTAYDVVKKVAEQVDGLQGAIEAAAVFKELKDDIIDDIAARPTSNELADPTGSSRIGFGLRTLEDKLNDVLTVDDRRYAIDLDDTNSFDRAVTQLILQGGGTIRIKARKYIITDSLKLNTASFTKGINITGEGELCSVIEQHGAGKSGIFIGGSMYLRSSKFTDFSILCTATAGHCLEFGALGAVGCDFNISLFQQNRNKSCVYIPFGQVYNTEFRGEKWEGTSVNGSADHNTPLMYVRAQGTTFNSNIIRPRTVYNAKTTPAIDVAGEQVDAWLTDNRFETQFEVCPGGGIKICNSRSGKFRIVMWDSHVAYTGHCLHFATNTSLSNISNVVEQYHRNGDTLAAGVHDIYTQGADFTTVIGAFCPADSGPSYDWANKSVTVLDLVYGEVNTINRTLLRGDTIISNIINGRSIFADDAFHIGGLDNPNSMKLSVSNGYIQTDALINNLGHIWSAKNNAGVVNKLVYDSSGTVFFPLTPSFTDLGIVSLPFKNVYLSGSVYVAGKQIVGERGIAIPDTTGSTLAALEAELNKLKAMCRKHGLIEKDI